MESQNSKLGLFDSKDTPTITASVLKFFGSQGPIMWRQEQDSKVKGRMELRNKTNKLGFVSCWYKAEEPLNSHWNIKFK